MESEKINISTVDGSSSDNAVVIPTASEVIQHQQPKRKSAKALIESPRNENFSPGRIDPYLIVVLSQL